eukprot:63250_1
MTEPSKKREHAQDTSPQHRSPAHKKRKTLPDALSQKMGVTEVLSQSQEFNFGSQITNVTKRRRKNNDTQMKLSFDQQEDQEENVHYDDYANETVHHDDDQDYDDDDQIRKLRTTIKITMMMIKLESCAPLITTTMRTNMKSRKSN